MTSDTIKGASAKDRGSDGAAFAQDKASEIASGMTASVADMAAGARNAASAAVDATGGLYDRAASQAKDALSSVPSSRLEAERLVRHGRRQVKNRVRKQPVEALLLAGAIGYLVGWATSRG